jgi:hypothetical protein
LDDISEAAGVECLRGKPKALGLELQKADWESRQQWEAKGTRLVLQAEGTRFGFAEG